MFLIMHLSYPSELWENVVMVGEENIDGRGYGNQLVLLEKDQGRAKGKQGKKSSRL